MAVVDSNRQPDEKGGAEVSGSAAEQAPQRLHRIRAVRLEQGLSLRSAARQMQSDIRTLRDQEQAHCDVRLSDLHRWQKALGVPITDLLLENETPLSRPVLERARMIRLMKTATAIRDRCESQAILRMAEMLIEQLVEVMPELKEVSPWHSFGQPRTSDECGRAAARQFSDDLLND